LYRYGETNLVKIGERAKNVLRGSRELILATLRGSTRSIMHRALRISVDAEGIPQVRVQSDRSTTTSLVLVLVSIRFEVVEELSPSR
jgi:hypothetical protein